MTFSIVVRARTNAGGDSPAWAYGVAVASKFLAVGSAVPAARVDAGALATQAMANLSWRERGLALLAQQVGAAGTLARLLGDDPLAEQRQGGIVDTRGGSATYTGAQCLAWAGGRHGPGYAVQGNILAGEAVVEAMERTWLAGTHQAPTGPGSIIQRLLAALAAGDQAGGDRRGRQSAALYVVAPGAGYGGSDTALDLRVDDHADPVGELHRLVGLHELYFQPPDPASLVPLQEATAIEVARRLTALGYPVDDLQGGLEAALGAWAEVENFEERMVPGAIDLRVLHVLRHQARAASEPS